MINIEFEPLEYSVSGKKATEYLRVDFPVSGKLTLTSVTETAEGKSVLECTGKRSSRSRSDGEKRPNQALE